MDDFNPTGPQPNYAETPVPRGIHSFSAHCMADGEFVCVFGVAGGRAPLYDWEGSGHHYSLRLMLFCWKFEITFIL